jgi:hypothetical protein
MNDVAAAPSSLMMTAYTAARAAAPGATVLYRVGELLGVGVKMVILKSGRLPTASAKRP